VDFHETGEQAYSGYFVLFIIYRQSPADVKSEVEKTSYSEVRENKADAPCRGRSMHSAERRI